MRISGKRLRDVQRAMHLVTGIVLFPYIYAGLGDVPLVAALVQWVILPTVAVSGMLMWQWPRLSRWFGTGRSRWQAYQSSAR